MLDRLIDFLLSCLKLFQFFVVIYSYERGVILRFGSFAKELGPDNGLRMPQVHFRRAWKEDWFGMGEPTGLHLCFPFGVDYVLVDNVVNRVVELGAQSLTTADGVNVTVNAVVTASIKDICKALLEVEGVDHALADSCCAAVGEHVGKTAWEDLRGEPAYESLTKVCRKQAFRYGIEIHRVQLKDLTRCRALRILTGERNSALDMFKQKVRL